MIYHHQSIIDHYKSAIASINLTSGCCYCEPLVITVAVVKVASLSASLQATVSVLGLVSSSFLVVGLVVVEVVMGFVRISFVRWWPSMCGLINHENDHQPFNQKK